MAPATVLPGYVHRSRAGDDAARGRRGIGSNRFVQMSNQAFLYSEALAWRFTFVFVDGRGSRVPARAYP